MLLSLPVIVSSREHEEVDPNADLKVRLGVVQMITKKSSEPKIYGIVRQARGQKQETNSNKRDLQSTLKRKKDQPQHWTSLGGRAKGEKVKIPGPVVGKQWLRGQIGTEVV